MLATGLRKIRIFLYGLIFLILLKTGFKVDKESKVQDFPYNFRAGKYVKYDKSDLSRWWRPSRFK